MSPADGPFSINIYAIFVGGHYNKLTTASHDMPFLKCFITYVSELRVIYRYILFVF